MASFFEKNGRVRARVRRHGVVLSETFSTRSDAEAWARKQESAVERGLWRDNSEAERTTVANALKRYKTAVTARKRGKTQEDSIIGILLDERLARLILARVGSSDVASMVDAWRKLSLAPATISRRLSVLSHVFETARRHWGMEALPNPVRLVKLPPLRNERERRVSDAEIDAICRATQSRDLASIVRLAVETAMRRGELVGMEWRYVDLSRRVVHLPETKNGHSRDVPLSTAACAVLTALQQQRKAERQKRHRKTVARPPKAAAEDDRVLRLRGDSVTQAFDRAVRRARQGYAEHCREVDKPVDATYLADLRFHDLRHEATSRLAVLFSIHELAKITGHRDLRMLMRYYHPHAEDLAKKLD